MLQVGEWGESGGEGVCSVGLAIGKEASLILEGKDENGGSVLVLGICGLRCDAMRCDVMVSYVHR